MKKTTIAIGAAAGAAAVIGGVFLAKVASARIHEPQPVTGPAAIERDIEELRRMKEEAVRRIEARQRAVADDLR